MEEVTMTALINDDVIGLPGQNLSVLELGVLVAMANGNSQRDIQAATNTDSSTLRMVEMQVRAKLGARTPSHMISRGFALGVLIPRALCLMLSLLCASEHSDDENRNQTRRNSRSIPATRLARNSTSRTASGSRNYANAVLLITQSQLVQSVS